MLTSEHDAARRRSHQMPSPETSNCINIARVCLFLKSISFDSTRISQTFYKETHNANHRSFHSRCPGWLCNRRRRRGTHCVSSLPLSSSIELCLLNYVSARDCVNGGFYYGEQGCKPNCQGGKCTIQPGHENDKDYICVCDDTSKPG
mgnify:CR=1 FL=1